MVRARDEGTSLIIEGTHLTPRLYARSGADLFFVLAAPPEDEHYARLTGWAHAGRKISAGDWVNIKKLNAYYLDQASRCGVKTVVYGRSIDHIATLIDPLVDEPPPEKASPDPSAMPPRQPDGPDYLP
jgi:2-phosphoglycerate kinase